MPTKTPTTPSFLTTARAFYGPAFDHKKKKALARSMAEWAEMDEDEQSFTAAHLAFLNLQAQAATQKLLTQVRDLLDEVAESLTTALEASLPDEEDEAEEEDDLVPGDVPDDDDLPPEPDAAPPVGEPVEEDDQDSDEDAAGDEGGEE